MTDVITFDVELTENQKMAQHKLYQVHKLYDEIEKLLGTQDVFNKPHMLLVLPNKLKKEKMTNEEWLKQANTEQLAEFIIKAMLFYDNAGITVLEAIKNAVEDNENLSSYFMESVLEWLKEIHE